MSIFHEEGFAIMNRDIKKIIKDIKRRDQVKQAALEKGWRSRWTLLFKAWYGADCGSHLEWLGFYDEAVSVWSIHNYMRVLRII